MDVKARGKTRILLADDHSLLREGIRSSIDQQDDMEVVGEADDGEEAVRLSLEMEPDIVIMDIVMPRLNGIEASKRIKTTYPTTAVLILTAYDDDRYVLGLLEAGAAGYLLKSARIRDVVEAVRTIRTGESVLHPSIIAKLLAYTAQTARDSDKPRREHLLRAREMQVMRLVAKGMSNKDIAVHLGLTVRTVKAHLSNIFVKLDVASRTEAILKGLREGWLVLE